MTNLCTNIYCQKLLQLHLLSKIVKENYVKNVTSISFYVYENKVGTY